VKNATHIVENITKNELGSKVHKLSLKRTHVLEYVLHVATQERLTCTTLNMIILIHWLTLSSYVYLAIRNNIQENVMGDMEHE